MADFESKQAEAQGALDRAAALQKEYELMKGMNLKAADADQQSKASQLESDAGQLFSSGDLSGAGDKFMEAYKITGRPSLVASAAEAYESTGEKTKAYMALEEYLKHAPDAEVPTIYERLRMIQRPEPPRT
jgi:tetratricopeptide (TPR) repeat protein